MNDNCKVETGNCPKTYQPMAIANFLTYEFSTLPSLNIACIGAEAILKAIDESLYTAKINKTAVERLNDLQVSTCGITFDMIKILATDPIVFAKPFVYRGLMGDESKNQKISFQQYLTEFSYKSNVLTLPVTLMLDNRHILSWELPEVVNAGDEQTVSIEMSIKETNGIIYSI